MGAGSSAVLARLLRRSLYWKLCPLRVKMSAAPGGPALGTPLGTPRGTPVGTPLGTPLANPPDVIEAHERYYSRETGRPAHYSYFSASPDRVQPALQAAKVADRKLPTQHQHPVQPSSSARSPATATAQRAPPKPERAGRTSTARYESRGSVWRPSSPCAQSMGRRSGAESHQVHTKRHRARAHPHRGCSRTSRTCRGSRNSRAHRDLKGAERRCFGYDIQDVDGFLAKSSLESPANIPMVLASTSTLYRTRVGGWQEEVALPLGMVVNGVFRASCWLYAQTPHGHEGYVLYASCLPLGILPAPATPTCPRAPRVPCWDTASDVFPAPSGNRTDTDKMQDTRSERAYRSRPSTFRSARRGQDIKGLVEAKRAELSVDELYLRASASSTTTSATQAHSQPQPRPRIVVQRQHLGADLSLEPGDILAVLAVPSPGWLQVRDTYGRQGLVPEAIADSGFL